MIAPFAASWSGKSGLQVKSRYLCRAGYIYQAVSAAPNRV